MSQVKKILIVDDEKLLAEMYATALTKAGYDVATSGDGDEGFANIKKLVPDLVLLDIMMPTMNGLDILDSLKKSSGLAKIPVIMLTNLTWVPDPDIALRKGALDVWVKAKNKPQEVVEKVNKFFAK